MWILIIIVLALSGGIVWVKINDWDLIEDFTEGFIVVGFITFLIIAILTIIAIANREVIEEYKVVDCKIQGLENKINRDRETEGNFILGFAHTESKTKEEIKYYYFRITEFGSKLETIKIASYSNTYIQETNEKEPCLIKHYQATKNIGIFKFLFGEDRWDSEIAETLVVPENTIKIEYNVEI